MPLEGPYYIICIYSLIYDCKSYINKDILKGNPLIHVTDAERKEFVDAFPTRSPDNGCNAIGSGSNISSKKKSRSTSVRVDVDDEVINTAVFIKRVFMVTIMTSFVVRGGREKMGWV